MKHYPEIPGAGAHGSPRGLPCIAFTKYDGSNLRFGWRKGQGWCIFGTRDRVIDRTEPIFGCSIDIFMKKYSEGIERLIKDHKHFRGVQEVICYCEFFGPFSFAGLHDPSEPVVMMGGCKGVNEPMDVVLFDVNVHKKGLMEPRLFVNTFEKAKLPVAEVVYEGNLNVSFIQDVRDGKYPVVEGVVCKGMNHKGKPPHNLWMTKIKTNAWKEELKRRFVKDWEKYIDNA